ncbi:hypothetical protein ACNOYE_12355 [Nannocystaceae bacterium ST9]
MTCSERKPPRLHLRLLVFALLALVLTFEGSCANAAYNRAYKDVIEREVDGYRHPGSLEELRRDTEAYLASLGYVPTPSSLATVETEWRTLDEDSRRRVHVDIARHPAGLLARVFVTQQDLTPQQYAAHSLEPRPDFERELHERLIPDASKRGDPAGFVYERPAQEIWDEATRLAFNLPETRSFHEPGPPIDAVAVSDWTEFEATHERSRLELRLHRHATGRYSIEANERVERATGERTWKSTSDERDIDLELGLIRHRDPLRVEKIEADAKAAGSEAFQEAIDHGAFACYCGG